MSLSLNTSYQLIQWKLCLFGVIWRRKGPNNIVPVPIFDSFLNVVQMNFKNVSCKSSCNCVHNRRKPEGWCILALFVVKTDHKLCLRGHTLHIIKNRSSNLKNKFHVHLVETFCNRDVKGLFTYFGLIRFQRGSGNMPPPPPPPPPPTHLPII